MKLNIGIILSYTIVIGIITGVGVVLGAFLFERYDSDIEVCMLIGVVGSWGSFIIHYKRRSTLPEIPD